MTGWIPRGNYSEHMTGWRLPFSAYNKVENEGPGGPCKTYDRVETGGTQGTIQNI